MIEMTWGQIRDVGFHQTVKKVFTSTFSFDTSLKVLSIIQAIDEEKKQANPMWDKHVSQFYTKAADGKLELKDKSEEFKKKEQDAIRKIATHSFKIRQPKIKASDLSRVELTPQELMSIYPLVEIDNNPVASKAKKKA
jgi:hypothetical protein